jgi:hypothetical protein
METWYANTSEAYSRSPPATRLGRTPRVVRATRPEPVLDEATVMHHPCRGAALRRRPGRDGYFTVTMRYIPSRSCPSMKHTSAYLPFFANDTSW